MLFTPTFGGNPIFGLAVEIDQQAQPAAEQTDAFFGVPGVVSLFGGTRGRRFIITGVLYNVDLPSVAGDEGLFLAGVAGSYVDGIVQSFRHLRPHVVKRRLPRSVRTNW